MKCRSAAVAVLIALGACSSDNGPSVGVEEPSPSTTTTESSTTTTKVDNASEAAKEYVEVLGSYDPGTMAQLLELSEPGSLAHNYAIHRIAVVTADRDAGMMIPPDDVVEEEGDAITLTARNPETDEEFTYVYSDFKADPDSNRLTSFSINGNDVASRLLISSGQTDSAGGVNLTLKSAYQAVYGGLTVTFDIENTTDRTVNVNTYSAVYIEPGGRQVQAEAAGGPVELRAGANAAGYVIFPDSEIGGEFILEGSTDDFMEGFEFTVSVS